MSHIFGGYKHFDSLKNTFFMGYIAQYFLTFFIEHPVFSISHSLPYSQFCTQSHKMFDKSVLALEPQVLDNLHSHIPLQEVFCTQRARWIFRNGKFYRFKNISIEGEADFVVIFMVNNITLIWFECWIYDS